MEVVSRICFSLVRALGLKRSPVPFVHAPSHVAPFSATWRICTEMSNVKPLDSGRRADKFATVLPSERIVLHGVVGGRR